MGKKYILLFLFVACVSFGKTGKELYYYIPEEVKILVDKTFSVYAVERVEAVYKIRGKEKAEKAIPFLLRLLSDNTPVWCKYNEHGMWTSVGKEAAKSLIKTGKPCLKQILLILKDNHPYIKLTPSMEKNLIYVLKGISGKNFKNDFTKWIEWIEENI